MAKILGLTAILVLFIASNLHAENWQDQPRSGNQKKSAVTNPALKKNSSNQNDKTLVDDSKRNEIRQVQKKLIEEGFQVKADGRNGAETRRALKQFQLNKNLLSDGQMNPETLQALGVKSDGSVGTTSSQTPNNQTRQPASVEKSLREQNGLEAPDDKNDRNSKRKKLNEVEKGSVDGSINSDPIDNY